MKLMQIPRREAKQTLGFLSKCIRNCNTCTHIDSNCEIVSCATRHRYGGLTDGRILTCTSRGVVYCLTCDNCNIQYVGMTTRSINERAREHIREINNKNSPKDTFLYEHFRSETNSHKSLKIQILYQTDITNAEQLKADLLEKETLWIRTLNTAYPYGLNDSLKGYGNISEMNNPLINKHQPYFTIPVNRRKRSHGKRHRKNYNSNNITNKTEESIKYIETFQNDIHKCYIFMRSLPKAIHKALLEMAMRKQFINKSTLLILGFEAKTFNKGKEPKTANPYRWKIPFINKGIEAIRIETIMKDKRLNNLLPAPIPRPISITYTYNFPNRTKLCNYNKELKTLTTERLKEIINKDCACKDYPTYVNKHYKHVLTGDLNIIKNDQLKKIFQRGASYRLCTKTDWKLNDEVIEEAISNLIEWFVTHSKKNPTSYDEYKNRFLQLYKSRKKHYNNSSVINDNANTIPLKELKHLHNDFIITVVDKASNNLVLVCKKLYMLTICKELGIDTETWTAQGNEIYKPTSETREELLTQHLALNKRYTKIRDDNESKLPIIYPIPKLHKNPYKFRFIAAAVTSSMKPTSILLDRILKHMKQHMENYTRRVLKTTGINAWYTIKSTKEFIQKIQENRHGRKCKILSGDFTSMFTALKQTTILKALYNLTEHCFKNAMNYSNSQFLTLGHNYNSFTKTRAENLPSFDKYEIMEIIEAQVTNSYVTFADYTFKQIQGTSMGSNASCSIADCVLIWHEYIYLTKICDKGIARKLNMSFRYVDDFITFADMEDTLILEHLKKMYPAELILEKTNDSETTTNFLDTSIRIVNNEIDTHVYNKTDDFPFKVIKYCSSGSMVHSSLGYKVFYGELFRFARICSCRNSFENKVRETFEDFQNNQYSTIKLTLKIFQFCTQNVNLAAKFNLHTDKEMMAFTCRLNQTS